MTTSITLTRDQETRLFTDGETTVKRTCYCGDNFTTLSLTSPAGNGAGQIDYVSSLFEHKSAPNPEGYITMFGEEGSNCTGETFKVTIDGEVMTIHC